MINKTLFFLGVLIFSFQTTYAGTLSINTGVNTSNNPIYDDTILSFSTGIDTNNNPIYNDTILSYSIGINSNNSIYNTIPTNSNNSTSNGNVIFDFSLLKEVSSEKLTSVEDFDTTIETPSTNLAEKLKTKLPGIKLNLETEGKKEKVKDSFSLKFNNREPSDKMGIKRFYFRIGNRLIFIDK